MSDQIIILVTAVTLAFAFGMAIGSSLERARQRRRKAQKEIDWMLEPPPPLGWAKCQDGNWHHMLWEGDKVYIDGRRRR